MKTWQFEENLNINLVPFDLIGDIFIDENKIERDRLSKFLLASNN